MADSRFGMIAFISFMMAAGLMFAAFGMNVYLDRYRIDVIEQSVSDHQIAALTAGMREDFASMYGVDACGLRQESIVELKERIRSIGGDLTRYGRASVYSERLDFLKRSYFLSQLELFAIVERTNELCDARITPVLFFYRIDHRQSERQGLALEEATRDRGDVMTFSFDIDYPDEPLLKMLLEYYGLESPGLIIDGKIYPFLSQREIREVLDFIRDEYGGVREDFTYVTSAAGIDEAFLAKVLLDGELSGRALGDAQGIAARIMGEDPCVAQEAYVQAGDPIAVLTLGSLRCDQEYRRHYAQVAEHFSYPLDVILENLSRGVEVVLIFDPMGGFEPFIPGEFDRMVIGESGMIITDQTILAQADRVTRDWLSGQVAQDALEGDYLSVFSERFSYDEQDLREDIGWHEGARLAYIEENSDANVLIGSLTVVARYDGRWYAPDEQGVFRFEVPLDKVRYPSNIFLSEDLVVVVDTHGANMLVAQAIGNDVDIVLACCDHEGKVHAAQYLAQRGIMTICMTDRFVPLALGTQGILGSPPIVSQEDGVRVGLQSISVDRNELVVVVNATLSPYALWYYTTPSLYFEGLPFDTIVVTLDGFDQQDRVVDAARESGASVIATRVFSRDDAMVLSAWLDEDASHRAILFHSTAYPYGFEVLRDYPAQVAFDDAYPRFI